MKSVRKIQLRRVQTIRFVLPIILFVIVAVYETWEHLVLKGEFYLDFHLTSEILFFGVLGPSAVFIVLSYVIRLMEKQYKATDQLEVLNVDLEQKVADRTELLEERNQELAAANKELQQLDQLKSDFVSLVSHELRGPLTTLNGGIEMALQESESLSVEAQRVLEIMSGESQRLTSFVQTILDVSRLDAGKLMLNPGPVAVIPLLRRVIEVVFARKNREIIFNDEKNLPLAWADEIYLEKILCNLLTNAEKYSPIDTPVEIRAQRANGNIQLSIIDRGPGIPEEMQDQVFKRFLRLETGEKISSKGWGLGLFFAQALADAQDCSLTLVSPAHENEEHPGSSFILTIPIDVEEPEDG